MTRVFISSWVRRVRPGGKWHLVESLVADDAITRCGKRMRDEPTSRGEPLEVHDGMVSRAGRPLDGDVCRKCVP